MAPSVYSTAPRAPWQAVPTATAAPPSCWHLYIGPRYPAQSLARLALYWDGYLQRWTWETNITAPNGGPGYRYGHNKTWPAAERAALAALADLLRPADQLSFLPPSFFGSALQSLGEGGKGGPA